MSHKPERYEVTQQFTEGGAGERGPGGGQGRGNGRKRGLWTRVTPRGGKRQNKHETHQRWVIHDP